MLFIITTIEEGHHSLFYNKKIIVAIPIIFRCDCVSNHHIYVMIIKKSPYGINHREIVASN